MKYKLLTAMNFCTFGHIACRVLPRREIIPKQNPAQSTVSHIIAQPENVHYAALVFLGAGYQELYSMKAKAVWEVQMVLSLVP